MRLTIIPSDKTVYQDSKVIEAVDMSLAPINLHALQWNGESGWQEFTDGTPNLSISELPEWANTIVGNVSIQAHQNADVNNISPELTLEIAKEQKNNSISTMASIEVNKGIEYKGVMIDSDRNSRLNIVERAAVMADSETVEWRTKANSLIVLTGLELKEIVKIIADHNEVQHKKAWAYKALIDNATTIAEVQNIIWE